MTRSGTLAAAAAATDAVTLSNSKCTVIVNKQAQTRSHHTLQGRKRSPSSSHPTPSRRLRSRVTKKIFNKNNNVSSTHLFARSNSTIGSRSPSSDSSSWSFTNSSRSSSS
ncbi:unnamed protein product [Rotaria sordida]|uniref:Uncharacterized protein n=1 Tax=Rotaria sordida TaxID=392033 RepID=A0A819T6J0_9BILA|nr:unnamed protein product [Rotaria sordida]CAF1491317.1 unnamed protein product [Rotaria sordida]CAF4061391.1 unnamed protein product [Rotaria sordida]CAF4106234.1 unnamed protein product [Rotaria sordida]